MTLKIKQIRKEEESSSFSLDNVIHIGIQHPKRFAKPYPYNISINGFDFEVPNTDFLEFDDLNQTMTINPKTLDKRTIIEIAYEE